MSLSSGGVLEIPSEGKSYQFKRFSVWKKNWILAQDGQKILDVTPDIGWKKFGASVEIDQTAFSTEGELSLLNILAWYVLILTVYDEYAAVSSGTTAAIIGATAGATATHH